MKVLVAGASGAVGTPAVRALVAAGHDVFGTTRSAQRAGAIERAGAHGVVMDALDQASAARAVDEVAPDAIVQLLTALPKRGPMRTAELEATNRLRIEGTRNLVGAARGAGVTRYVSESIVLGYGPTGERPAVEDDPFARLPDDHPLAAPMNALRSLEEQVRGFAGIVLRFGFYYGPSTGGQQMLVRLARRRMLMVPAGDGVAPWVHVEDAASAVVAALERGKPGEAYNIVGDEPASGFEFAGALARSLGTPGPRRMPRWLARIVMPYLEGGLDMTLRVSNEKARLDLGWTPRYPTIEAGLRAP